MFSFFLKKMSVRIFTGKNQSSVTKIVGTKICPWQKKLSFFADFFSSDKVVSILKQTPTVVMVKLQAFFQALFYNR